MGVVMMILCGSPLLRQSVGLIRQPGISRMRLPRAQTPRPLVKVVGPPSLWRVMWSMWRIGASQNGSRQVWSRRRMSLASQPS